MKISEQLMLQEIKSLTGIRVFIIFTRNLHNLLQLLAQFKGNWLQLYHICSSLPESSPASVYLPPAPNIPDNTSTTNIPSYPTSILHPLHFQLLPNLAQSTSHLQTFSSSCHLTFFYYTSTSSPPTLLLLSI